jgi:peptide/nickel transport system substrate-binding protein
MRRRFNINIILFASILGFTLANSTTAVFAAEKVLTISMDAGNAGQDSFNPFTTNRTNNVYYLVYDRLVEMGADGIIYPHLLKSWNVSADGMTITFTLRDGVKFHDGSDLNADVLKWFLENLSTGKSKYMVAAVGSIDIKDNLTVVLNMSRPDPNILYNFTSSFTGVPSKQAIEKYGEEFGRKYVVGTGAFKFVSWKAGAEVVLEKNADYQWGSPLSDNQGPAHIDKIVVKEILEDSTRFLELKTGGVDILEKAPTLFLDKIKNDPSANVISMASNGNYQLVMNTKREFLKNVKIRQAIALAVDQNNILKAVFQGYGTPAYTYLIDRLPARNVAPEFEIHFNLDKAKAIMAKEGWTLGSDGILAKDGKKLSLKLWSKSDSDERKTAVVLQDQLSKLGVDIKIEQFDPSSIKAEYKKGEHDLVVRSYGWDNADILEWFFNSARPGYPNVAMWHDNESDYLMHKAMTRSKDSEERIQNFKDYHEYVLSQFIWAPIINSVNNHAISTRVHMPAPRFKILIGAPIQDITLD